MYTIPDQMAWERECLERGTARYYANQDRMRKNGSGTDTDTMSYLLKERLVEVAEAMEALVTTKRGRAAKYNKLLRTAVMNEDYMKAAYIGLQSVFHSLAVPAECTVLKICLGISARLEADLKCQMFEAEYPAYYAVVCQSFTDQKVTDYAHRHKVLMKKFNDFNMDWNDWTAVQKVQVGQRVLRCILEVFDDVLFINKEWKYGKSVAKLDTTIMFDDWAAEFERERGFMFPYLLPLKVKPRDWDNEGSGGFYSPALYSKFPLIKTRGKMHKDFVTQHDPEQHRLAINKMQSTAWEINKEVLEVQKLIFEKGLKIGMPSSKRIRPPEFPEHLKDIDKCGYTTEQMEEVGDWKALAKRAYGKEQERKGKVIAFMQAHKLAKELEDWDKFYFAYNCDFRGRIYCATAGLSPQGADTAKGILRFRQGVRLGSSGIRWLAIHGANVYGKDKVSYDDRVAWIRRIEPHIRQIVEDPINYRSTWAGADKPYQFLAFCYEWARSDYGRDTTTIGHLPVGLDGSCNGLQHFSAMLRDEVGAKATNLLACDKPADIYGEVAAVTTFKLSAITHAMAQKWLQVGVNRKCAKRPVMTLPYGAKIQSARQAVLEYAQDNWAKFSLDEKHQFEFAKFLTPILWESIGEVVIAAREAMDWLQVNVPHDYCKWLTPINFPVFQYYQESPQVEVRTKLNGNLRLYLRDITDDAKPHQTKQRSGIAPNFVHSIDSTHMVMTINMIDVPAYAMIHDDFGTHAGNTEELFRAVRKSFHKLYSKHDPLLEWAHQQGIGCSLEKGEYNIESIYDADYFFG